MIQTNGEHSSPFYPPPEWSTSKTHTKSKVYNSLGGHHEPQDNVKETKALSGSSNVYLLTVQSSNNNVAHDSCKEEATTP